MSVLQESSDDEIDLGQILGVLWGGRVWIAIATALGIAVGAFSIADTNPTFQADALLQLEERSGNLALPSSLVGMLDNDPRSVTEIEIMRSRLVLGRAIAEQNLDWRITPDVMPVAGTMFARYRFPIIDEFIPKSYVRPGDAISLDNLVVPPSLLNQQLEVRVRSTVEYQLILPDGRAFDGLVGVPITLEDEGLTVTLASIEAPAGRRFFIRQLDENRAISALRGRMSVSERGRSSNIVEVRLTGESRAENVRALNAIIQAYLGQNVSRSAAEAESSLEFIRDRIPQAEADLRDAEAALNQFRQDQISIDLSIETQNLLQQVMRIENELLEIQGREEELAQRFTPSHPSYRQVLDERARLEARLVTLREQVGELPETQREFLNLTREVELSQRIYTELLTRAQEVEVLRASTIGNVRIIDSASSLTSPVAPRKSLVLVMSLVLGAIAGIGAVLVRNWLRKGIKSASELEKQGLPVFATINYSKLADTAGKRGGKIPILVLENADDLTSEAVRSLRTSLHFGMLDAQTPSVNITSSHPGAGKSFLSMNLGAATALSGQSVCIIDADMRRGQLRRYFDLPRDRPGLAQVLARDIAAEDAIVQGPLDNMFLLPAGRYPPNPSELLMRAELSQLIEWCAERFDLTIVDAPPVLAVTDPVIIGRSTGSSIFVARHGITQLAEVEAAQKTFSAAGLKFSGAVLNGFDPKKAGSGYGYGYGYNYGYRYTYQQREN